VITRWKFEIPELEEVGIARGSGPHLHPLSTEQFARSIQRRTDHPQSPSQKKKEIKQALFNPTDGVAPESDICALLEI
jgi:hypothetical protein